PRAAGHRTATTDWELSFIFNGTRSLDGSSSRVRHDRASDSRAWRSSVPIVVRATSSLPRAISRGAMREADPPQKSCQAQSSTILATAEDLWHKSCAGLAMSNVVAAARMTATPVNYKPNSVGTEFLSSDRAGQKTPPRPRGDSLVVI